jgi:hypothetical protein
MWGTLVKRCSPDAQETGGHLLENRVFGPVGLNVALEGASGLYDERTHPLSIAGPRI